MKTIFSKAKVFIDKPSKSIQNTQFRFCCYLELDILYKIDLVDCWLYRETKVFQINVAIKCDVCVISYQDV